MISIKVPAKWLLLSFVSIFLSASALQTTNKSQSNKATRQLINQNFRNKVTRTSAVRTNVEVLQKESNRVLAEAVVVFLDKNTDTATASKMQYDVVEKTVPLKRKIEQYALL